MNTYKVEMYIKGSEEDAVSLRKSLAQTVYDEFELGSVFGVTVRLDEPAEDAYSNVMALCIVSPDTRLCEKQVDRLMEMLPSGKKYTEIDFRQSVASAYGFVDFEYLQTHNHDSGFLAEQVGGILSGIKPENPDETYMTPDGRQFFLGYLSS